MWTTSALIARPGENGAETKTVTGNKQDIERQADEYGAIFVQFAGGEIWRKLFGEWVVTKSGMY